MQEPLSLKNTILNRFSLDQLKNVCFNSVYSNALDCQWDVWKNRMEDLYNIPFAYFDLALGTGIPGIERYIEILTQLFLNEDSKARKNNGFFEGVYEILALIKEAVKRNDWEILPEYLESTPRNVKDYIKTNIIDFVETSEIKNSFDCINTASFVLLEKLNIKQDYIDKKYALRKIRICPWVINTEKKAKLQNIFPEYINTDELIYYIIFWQGTIPPLTTLYRGHVPVNVLLAMLSSGRIDYADKVLHYHGFPENFSIAKVIKLFPFEPNQKEFPLTELDFRTSFPMPYLGAAMKGGNVQIVDFFRSALKVNIIPTEYLGYLVFAYRWHRYPAAVYSILQRCNLDYYLIGITSYNYITETTPYLIPPIGNVDLLVHMIKTMEEKIVADSERKEQIEDRISHYIGMFIRLALRENIGNIPIFSELIAILSTLKNGKILIEEIDKGIPELYLYPLSRQIIIDSLEE